MVAAMPEAELLVLSGAAHGAPLTHPREIASALVGFFKGRPAVRGMCGLPAPRFQPGAGSGATAEISARTPVLTQPTERRSGVVGCW